MITNLRMKFGLFEALLQDTPPYLSWLPLLAVLGFLFLGNVGYGTLIWVVTAELLPPKVLSQFTGTYYTTMPDSLL